MNSYGKLKKLLKPLLVLLILAGIGIGTWFVLLHRGTSAPRNIIVIVIDTVRRDALGCYGNRDDLSPRIDTIAAEGVRFEQAISTSGWTLPAVGSLLTGIWPTLHGAIGKGTQLIPIRDEIPTAAEVFKQNGFDTFGVANAAFVSPMLHLDRGFDVYDHRHAFNKDIRRADETIDTALKLIQEHKNTSNFVFIHIFDPHLDYDPPPGFETKFIAGPREPKPPLSRKMCEAMQTNHGNAPPSAEDIEYITGTYYGEVNFADTQVGRLVDELKQMDLYDQTALIITADHGEEFWEHGGFEHGHTLYDELIRIPLIIKLPASMKPVKRVVTAQVRILDVMPTLFSLAGIEQPESFIGQSLISYIMGETEKDLIAFSESTLYGNDIISWRSGRYKYLLDLNSRDQLYAELYDWHNDPEEKENLFHKDSQIAQQLHQQLVQFFDNLQMQAQTMSQPKVENISPTAIESLKTLGYIR